MRSFLACLVAVSLFSCGPGRPTASPLDPAGLDVTELIPYRTLTREDFKAPMAMGFSVTEEERIAATTCATILVRPPKVVTRGVRSSTGETVYVSSLDEPIFFAVLNRKCSWWGPIGSRTEEDVLEHEQIHFAIYEIEARRLNARKETIVQRVESSGTDLGSVRRRAMLEFQSILEQASEVCRGRNTLYDDQVFPADRVRQRQWLHRVTAELETLQPFARGPQLSLLPNRTPELVEPVPAPPVNPVPPLPAPATPPAPAAPAIPPRPTPERGESPGSTVSFPD